jgi:ribosomal protein L32E
LNRDIFCLILKIIKRLCYDIKAKYRTKKRFKRNKRGKFKKLRIIRKWPNKRKNGAEKERKIRGWKIKVYNFSINSSSTDYNANKI